MKKLYSFFSFLAFTFSFANAQLPSYLPANGLVAWYPFNGNANDESGNGNHGTVNGATLTTDRFGNVGKSYSFNGVNNFISVPGIAIQNNLPRTTSIWFQTNSSIGEMIISTGSGANQNGATYNIRLVSQGFLSFMGGNFTTSGYDYNPTSGISLNNNIWHNAIVVFQSGEFKFYIDGILYSTFNITISTSGQSNFIGKSNDANSWNAAFFSGKIDDIAIYNRALTPAEVTALYTGVPICIANITNNDTTICKGSSITLNAATATGNTYRWSTNATTPSITVTPTATTKYYCTVTNGTNTCKDSVTVTVSTIATNIITADTVKVCGTSASITAIAGLGSYSWSNGASTQATTVTSSGWYRCTATNGACTARDSVYVSLLIAKILSNDTTICSGNNIVLTTAPTAFREVIDIDGNKYPTIQYGNQEWMGENLRTTKYSNGDSIAVINDGAAWYNTTSTRIGARAEVGGNINNSLVYGKLYNFFATQDNRNVCPSNWHIPSDSEWTVFIRNIDPTASSTVIGNQSLFAGKLLKDTNPAYWNVWYAPTPANSNNLLKFNMRGTGQRGYYGNYYNVGEGTFYWTSTPAGLYSGYIRGLNGLSTEIGRGYPTGIDNASNGGSLRCVRNASSAVNIYTYLWSNGSTTPSIAVAPTTTTSYIATVSNGINTCKDTVKVTVNALPTNIITVDTVKACGTSASITAASGFASYNWSNGAATASTTVTTSGWYKCTVTNAAGCSNKDSVYVSLFNPKIVQNDTTVCAGSSLTLTVNNNVTSSMLPANLRTGLVGYWPFNGNANDESGNGNNGTVNGATLTTDRFGNVGKAYSFDTNKFIEVPSSNSLNTSNGSISFWFKTSQTSLQLMIYKCIANTAANENYAIGINAVSNNEISFYVKYNSNCSIGNGWVNCQTNNTYSDNLYHHLVGIFNSDSLYLYIDGIKKSTMKTPNTIADVCQPSSLFFGRDWMSNQIANFKGNLDDVIIYNHLLTASEIQQLYSGATSTLWSTGATTPSIAVAPTTTTSYIATVSNGINTCKDTVKISIYTTPAAPTAIQKQFVPTSVLAVTNVSGLISETYRIRKVPNAVSYDWSLRRGTAATITRLNPLGVNDTAVTVTFASCFLRDTLCVKSVGVCSTSVAKTVILTANTTPAGIGAITTSGGNFAVCIGSSKSFTAYSTTPSATQTIISRYRWTLSANAVITSANADSSTITVQFNAGFTGGTISVRGVNACTGTLGASLSSSLQFLPPTPYSIASSTGLYNACINNTITYTAMVPAPTTSQSVASIFRWTRPANTSIVSATADSSSITLRFNTGFTGGVLSVRGQTSCGTLGTVKSQTLTSIGCKVITTKENPITQNDLKSTSVLDAHLYPNPSVGSFNLKITTIASSPIIVKVFSTNGQLMKSFVAKANTVNTIGNELKAGVYLISIMQHGVEKTLKAIKL